MKHALDKIAKKNNTKSLILSDKEVADKKVQKRAQIAQIKKSEDEQDILGANSTSVQSWNNVPRFHMERIMGKSEKVKRQELIDNRLKKANQKGINTFLEIDPYMAKCDYFEK